MVNTTWIPRGVTNSERGERIIVKATETTEMKRSREGFEEIHKACFIRENAWWYTIYIRDLELRDVCGK